MNQNRCDLPAQVERLIASLLVLMGLLLSGVAPAPLPAQQSTTDAQAVRLAGVRFMVQRIERMPEQWRTATPRVLEPGPLRQVINGQAVVTRDQPAAPTEAELASLTAQLGGRVATRSDSIWCQAKEGCHGTLGLWVHLGEPMVQGDSAVILGRWQRRSADGVLNFSAPSDKVAIFLRRSGAAWQVTSFSYADHGVARDVLPVDPMGRVIKRDE